MKLVVTGATKPTRRESYPIVVAGSNLRKSTVQPFMAKRHGKLTRVAGWLMPVKAYRANVGGAVGFIGDFFGMDKYRALVSDEAKKATYLLEAVNNVFLDVTNAGKASLEHMMRRDPASLKRFMGAVFEKVNADVERQGTALKVADEAQPYGNSTLQNKIETDPENPNNVILYHATKKVGIVQKEGIKPSVAGVIKKDPQGAKVFASRSFEGALLAQKYEEELRMEVSGVTPSKGDIFVVKITIPKDDISIQPNGDIITKRVISPNEFLEISDRRGFKYWEPQKIDPVRKGKTISRTELEAEIKRLGQAGSKEDFLYNRGSQWLGRDKIYTTIAQSITAKRQFQQRAFRTVLENCPEENISVRKITAYQKHFREKQQSWNVYGEKVMVSNRKSKYNTLNLIVLPQGKTPEERINGTLSWVVEPTVLTSKSPKYWEPQKEEYEGAFKNWFGKSKVVDKNGNPLVVFHGTANSFSTFKQHYSVHVQNKNLKFFFTANTEVANKYAGSFSEEAKSKLRQAGLPEGMLSEKEGGNVIPVFLKIETPLEFDMKGKSVSSEVLEKLSELVDGKHDGVILLNVPDLDLGITTTEYIVLKPIQIKSAIGNVGTFNPKSSDITKAIVSPFYAKRHGMLSRITGWTLPEKSYKPEPISFHNLKERYDSGGDKPFEMENIKLKAYRVGELTDNLGRGIFFSADREGAEAYAGIHEGYTVKEYDVNLRKVLVAGHQNSVCKLFFNKSYGRMVDEYSHKYRSEVKGGQAFDKRIKNEARRRGFEGIVYTESAPPAEMELMLVDPKLAKEVPAPHVEKKFDYLRKVADRILPPDDDKYRYFYHATRSSKNLENIVKDGIVPSDYSGGKTWLSKNEVRNLGGGYFIVRVPKDAKIIEEEDIVERGLSYKAFVIKDRIPPEDIVKVFREIPIKGTVNQTINEFDLAKYAMTHQTKHENISYLPEKYQRWFDNRAIEVGQELYVIKKAKQVYVPAGIGRKAYYRYDPRTKDLAGRLPEITGDRVHGVDPETGRHIEGVANQIDVDSKKILVGLDDGTVAAMPIGSVKKVPEKGDLPPLHENEEFKVEESPYGTADYQILDRLENKILAAKNLSIEELRKRMDKPDHSIEALQEGKIKIITEGEGGDTEKKARELGLFVEDAGGFPIISKTKEEAKPMLDYLKGGGKYGSAMFSKLLGYTDDEISEYVAFIIKTGQEKYLDIDRLEEIKVEEPKSPYEEKSLFQLREEVINAVRKIYENKKTATDAEMDELKKQGREVVDQYTSRAVLSGISEKQAKLEINSLITFIGKEFASEEAKWIKLEDRPLREKPKSWQEMGIVYEGKKKKDTANDNALNMMSELARLHNVNLPTLTGRKLLIRGGRSGGTHCGAVYFQNQTTIEFKEDSLTALPHEFGHFLDYEVLPKGGFLGTGFGTTDIVKAVRETPEHQEMINTMRTKEPWKSMRYSKKPMWKYMDTPTEIWARAYEAWVLARLPEGSPLQKAMDERMVERKVETPSGIITNTNRAYAYPLKESLSKVVAMVDRVILENLDVVKKALESFVILEKSKRIFVPAGTNRKAYYRTDPRSKHIERKNGDFVLDNPKFKEWFEGSKVVDEKGKPLKVFHGTTHDFKIFEDSHGYSENDFGIAHYFTSDEMDVNYNYASVKGADLVNRIDTRASQLEDIESMESDEALKQATQELTENEGVVMPVYLSVKNPLILSERGGTFFDYSFDEKDETEEGLGADLMIAIKEYFPEKIAQKLLESIGDYIAGGVGAWKILKKLKSVEDYYLDDREGNQLLQEVIKSLGFDGIIIEGVANWFPRMGNFTPGAKHVIVFNSTQIKSAIGNTGAFDPHDPDITKSSGKNGVNR